MNFCILKFVTSRMWLRYYVVKTNHDNMSKEGKYQSKHVSWAISWFLYKATAIYRKVISTDKTKRLEAFVSKINNTFLWLNLCPSYSLNLSWIYKIIIRKRSFIQCRRIEFKSNSTINTSNTIATNCWVDSIFQITV